MKTSKGDLEARTKARMTHAEDQQQATRKALLVCGILSSLLYVAMNVFVAMQWQGYSSASQTISELSAIGAPTRTLWVVLGIVYSVLVTAFGWGVWVSARRGRSLRVVGALMLAYGATGLAWPFAPMHLRGAEFALTDAMHIGLGVVTVLLYLLALAFGAAAFGKRFRIYSIATLVIVVALGALTGMDGPRLAANLPTPWIGLWERISIGVVLLWVVVLAVVLLRATEERSRVATSGAPGETKKKKIVTAFVGSGRKQRGLTYAATRQLLSNLESHGDVQGEIVFLSEHTLGLCRGCKVCFEHGEERCPLKGDRDLLIEKMRTSDGIVLASPNYSFQVSSTMKAFLDRLGYVFHRPIFHGKAFTGIVAQGFIGGGKIEKYLRFVGTCLGCNVVKGSCITALEPATARDLQKMNKALARQSRRFHAQLAKPSHAAPSLFQLMGFRMGRTCVKQTLSDDNRDYIHYRDRGWFDSDYYYPTTLGTAKRALGALFDGFFARVYKRVAPGHPQPAPLASPMLVKEVSDARAHLEA